MIVAQVLITIMVVQWLNMQWSDKRQVLEKELSQAWTGSHQQMIDSMLMNQYILPAMDSANENNFTFRFITDSTEDIRTFSSDEVQITDQVRVVNGPHGKAMPKVSMPRQRTTVVTTKTDTSGSINAKDLVLRGVKLFVNVQSDSLNHIGHAQEMLTPDTSILKSAFRQKLFMMSPRLVVQWDSATITESAPFVSPFSFTAEVNDFEIRADVDGSARVLLPEILPQGFFALLLIIITAAAFLISYRSLRSQIVLDAQRNDFIHNMSHEIRTPVSTVKVALEALKNFDRSNDPAVMKEYLEMAMHETNRLEQLVGRVTDISSDGAPVSLNFKEEDVNQIIDEVLQSMKPRLEGEKALVNFKKTADKVNVYADKLHLHGVVFNLIDNSLKYSKPPAEITIETERDDHTVNIKVSDRGKGIPEAYSGKIFEKFFRVPTGDVHNIKGYGLGLSYAKMVLRQHNGSISYRGREGGGSLFLIRLKAKG